MYSCHWSSARPVHSGAPENRAEDPCDPPVNSESRLASGTPMRGSAIVTMAIANPPSRAAASEMSSPITPGMSAARMNTSAMFHSAFTP